jgi:hypothetical protein
LVENWSKVLSEAAPPTSRVHSEPACCISRGLDPDRVKRLIFLYECSVPSRARQCEKDLLYPANSEGRGSVAGVQPQTRNNN